MPLILEERIAGFISGPAISIAVASRDEANRATLFKAVGCRVAETRDRITVYLDQQVGRDVVRCLRAGYPIAAVFSEPATHRTLQIKGARADVGGVTPAEREFVRERYTAIVEHVAQLDYPEEGVRCYFHYAPEHLVAVSFAPDAAFEQTPGPGAGAALAGGAP